MSSFKYNDNFQMRRNYSLLFHTKLVHLAPLISLHLYKEPAFYSGLIYQFKCFKTLRSYCPAKIYSLRWN